MDAKKIKLFYSLPGKDAELIRLSSMMDLLLAKVIVG